MSQAKYKSFVVAEEAVKHAMEAGIAADVEGQIINMARLAAPVTHPLFNRRYGDFVLWIDTQNVVQDVGIIERNHDLYLTTEVVVSSEECTLCYGTELARVYEEIDGEQVPMFRPCARAMNGSLPVCDLE